MIALRFLPRAEWEAELRYYRCKPLEGKGPLNTAEWWRMEWYPHIFTVPIEADGRLLVSDLDALRLMILECAPEGTQFD